MDDEMRRFESRIKAGADFAVTHPIFDLDLLEVFCKCGIPVIAGIRPLASFGDAEYVVNELRVPIPEPYLERMRRADSAEAARAEGVAIAREMVQRVRPLVAGVQLSMPFGQYQTAIDVAQAIER
jgi:homocysteine S-methyltransferase